MRYLILTILVTFGFTLTIISCSSEDDAALKDGKVASDISEVDQLEAPSGTVLINNGASSTSTTQVSLSLSAADSGLVNGYYVSETNSAPSSTATGWGDITGTQNYSATIDFTISSTTILGEHPRTVYAWFKDTAENVSSVASDSIILIAVDTTSPSNTTIIINDNDSSTTNTNVTIDLSASDDYGVSAYYLSETNTKPSNNFSGWTSVTSSTSYSDTINFSISNASSAGYHGRTVYAWFKDETGNVSSTTSDNITLFIPDTTSPSNTSVIINNNDSTTSSTIVNLGLYATDDVGVVAYYASNNDTSPSNDANGWEIFDSTKTYSYTDNFTITGASSAGNFNRTVYVWFKDSSGNLSSVVSDSITLSIGDTTDPANPSVTINSGDVSTTLSNVTLNLSATDNVGVVAYYASENSSTPTNNSSGWNTVSSSTNYSSNVNFSISGDSTLGSHSRTVFVWFKDAAGNISSNSSDSITFIVSDNTAPQGSVSRQTRSGNGFKTAATVTVAGTDDYGITKVCIATWRWSTSNICYNESDFSDITSTTNYTNTFEGPQSSNNDVHIYVIFKDGSGNISATYYTNY